MLSFEHVRLRRKADELSLVPLGAAARARALEISHALAQTAHASVGETREELSEKFETIERGPRERKLFLGLMKLVDDACEFEAKFAREPGELRENVFSRAAELWRAGEFSRERALAEASAELGLTPDELEQQLYADLRGAHRLIACRAPAPENLVSFYESQQVQAVLLRAVRVVAEVRCHGASAYRELFRKLKFRKLLHRIERLENGKYRLEIDGPFSLFDNVVKYGLELALMLPALEACDELDLVASVQAKDRARPLLFRHRSGAAGASSGALTATKAEPSLRDEVSELIGALHDAGQNAGADVHVAVCDEIIDLPGLGVVVPDLVLRKVGQALPVYVELLGFWSREAVWKRVELVERGLSSRMLFVASSRLRVSEEVLDESDSAALYVYRGRINARALLQRALRLFDAGE